MKYFSLFKGEEIHVNPEEKVIPESEYSLAIEAFDIVKKAKQDTEEHKRKTEKHCDELKKEAYEKGYEKGLEKLNKNILQLDQDIKNLRNEFNKKVLPIALKAAKKILGNELKLHPERIIDIVKLALKPVTQHHMIRIYVNKEDLSLLEENKPNIKGILDNVEIFVLQERSDIEQGGCIIETEAGIINAQLDNQWRALEAAFNSFKTE